MKMGIGKVGVLLAAGAALQVAEPDTIRPQAGLSPDQLAQAMCSGRKAERGALLRARLHTAAAHAASESGAPGQIPLIEGLGAIHRPVSTASPAAQRYFDQGLAFAYGFNHDAAVRSFRAAQAIDPACAMCFWGEALALGPNINAPMKPEALPQARAAIAKAQGLAGSVTPVEQGLIAAMALRYQSDSPDDRTKHDAAYFGAMRAQADRFPDDAEVAILAVEAAMDTQPWDYWDIDGRTPKGNAGWAIDRVARVLERHPDNPQAIHLQIHLLEASKVPGRGLAAANRLNAGLTPANGHLVHMPSHLFVRTGRYRDSIAANRAAAAADEQLIARIGDRSVYRYGYFPHNVHFLLVSAQMAGDQPTVEAEAARLARLMDVPTMQALAWVQVIQAAPYFAHGQFSDPATILDVPAPDGRLPYSMAMWHYSRALARAAQRDDAGFARELAEIRTLRTTADWKPMTDQLVPATDLLRIAEHVAEGRMAAAGGKWKAAEAAYRKAAALEATLPYAEPPYWYFPVNQSLGAVLLQQGDAQGAERAFLQALAAWPGNGWALFGLAQAQTAQGRMADAAFTRAALSRAWAGDPAALKLERL
jgi:tetratricopeptide (TPR) repeat protein